MDRRGDGDSGNNTSKLAKHLPLMVISVESDMKGPNSFYPKIDLLVSRASREHEAVGFDR
jgi:hypothetical protein